MPNGYIISQGHRYYYYLNKPSDNLQKKCLRDDIPDVETMFIVQKQLTNGNRVYTALNSYLDLVTLIQNTDPVYRTFNEVIFGSQPQKLRFDVDISNIPNYVDLDLLGLNVLGNTVDSIINTFQQVYEKQLIHDEILICSSHNNIKKSYHLIIPRYAVSSAQEARYFYDCVVSNIPKEYHQYLDHQIYNNLAHFRTLMSTKHGQMRPKIIEKTWYHHDNIIHFKPLEQDPTLMQWFEYSLITVTHQCEILPNRAPQPVIENKDQLVDVNVFSEALMKLPPNVYRPTNTVPHQTGGCRLHLVRIKTAECNYCHREHTNNGAYLHYNPTTQEITFVCLADVSRKKYIIIPGKKRRNKKHYITDEKFRNQAIDISLFQSTITNQPEMSKFQFTNKKTLVVRGACGTGKTTALCECIRDLPTTAKVLIISFRRSLAGKQYHELQPLGFVKYDEVNTPYYYQKRLIVQIDSLHKVRGKYDLLVLDEVEYVLQHLVEFVKEKRAVFEALCQHIKFSEYVIAMDALLYDTTINLLHSCGRDIEYIHNTYKKHSDKTIKLLQSQAEHCGLVLELLKNNKKLYIPTNTEKYAKQLHYKIQSEFPNLQVGLYTGMTMKDNPNNNLVAEWATKDVVICTPTIVAGLSFTEDHFDATVGYFVSRSASAEMALQQIFRVRCLKSNTIYICVKQQGGCHIPSSTIEGVKDWIVSRDRICHKDITLGIPGLNNAVNQFKINYIENEFDTTDPYFELYAQILRRINESHRDYIGRLLGMLRDQGCQFSGYVYPEKLDTVTETYFSRLLNDLGYIKTQLTDAECIAIATAPPITEKEYHQLNERKELTKEKIYQKRRYYIMKTYRISDEEMTKDFVKEYGDHMSQHYNRVKHLVMSKLTPNMNPTAISEIATTIIETVVYPLGKPDVIPKELRRPEIIQRLHDRYVNYAHRHSHCLNFLFYMGFISIFDRREIMPDFESLKRYINNNRDELEKTFDCECRANTHQSILKFVNQRLNAMFAIKIINMRKITETVYTIISLLDEEIIEENGIQYLIPTGKGRNHIKPVMQNTIQVETIGDGTGFDNL